MTKEQYLHIRKFINTKIKQEDAIEHEVEKLIASLYIPTEEGYRVDKKRLDEFDIDNEPINWGDLHFADISLNTDGDFIVTIEEASPDDCPSLCYYLEKFLHIAGWSCIVKTEW